jgi:hypothetical protein
MQPSFGAIVVHDAATGGVAKLVFGMTKKEVEKVTTRANVAISEKNGDEWKVGDQLLIFEDDKLARIKTLGDPCSGKVKCFRTN